MRLNAAGIKLQQQSEGCRLSAYLDTNGIPTIGWGSIYIVRSGKLRRVAMGDTCSQAEADEMWLAHENENEGYLNSMLKVEVTDNEYGAIMDFLYQFGPGNLKTSTLLEKINEGPKDTCDSGFLDAITKFITKADTVHTPKDEAEFIAEWTAEAEKHSKDTIAFQFLRWVHGSHGEVVFGILKRQMNNINLYNTL